MILKDTLSFLKENEREIDSLTQKTYDYYEEKIRTLE